VFTPTSKAWLCSLALSLPEDQSSRISFAIEKGGYTSVSRILEVGPARVLALPELESLDEGTQRALEKQFAELQVLNIVCTHMMNMLKKSSNMACYIHTYIYAYIHTYMHTYTHACMHTCMHMHTVNYIQNNVPSQMRETYTHTHMPACMHTYIHAYVQFFTQNNLHVQWLERRGCLGLMPQI
jgi:hypothetical protein